MAAGQARQLGAVGGFTGALKTHHHHNGGALGGEGQLGVGAAHQLHQLLVDDLHDLLGGGEAVQHVCADAALRDLGHKVLDHLIADVGFQQGQADLPHTLPDVGLRQAALAPQAFECGA